MGIWKIIKTRRSEGQEKVRRTNRTQWDAWSYTCLSISCKLPGVIGSAIPEWRNPSSFEEVYFLSTHLMSNNQRPPTGFHQWWLQSTVTGCFVTPLVYAEAKTDGSPRTISTPLAFLPNLLRDWSADRRGPPQRPGNVKLLCSHRFKVPFLNVDTQTWPCAGTGVWANFDSQM